MILNSVQLNTLKYDISNHSSHAIIASLIDTIIDLQQQLSSIKQALNIVNE